MMMMAPSVVQQQDTAGVKPPDEGGSHGMQLNSAAAARLASERKQKAAGGGQASAEGGGGGPTAAQKCPRCDSVNTKFCYYNNYSLSQPRHFCKNCRRYWTKGGALRNVPIGGGCRKNKRINHINPAGSPGHSPSGKQIGQGHQLRAGFEPLASSALASLDASSLLASMGPPPGLFSGGPSTSSFMNPDVPAHHHHHHPHHHLGGLTFSRLQESLRLGDHPGAASASPSTMFSLSPANHLLNLSSNSPALQLPPSFDAASFPTLNYPSNTTTSAGKLADQSTAPSLLFNHGGAADFSPFFESVSSCTSAPIISPVLEDHLSTFNSSNNSSSNNINMAPDQDGAANNNSTQNNNNLRQQLHSHGLALQMLNDVGGPQAAAGGQQGDDGHADHHHHHHHHHHQHQNNDSNNAITRGHAMLPGFEEETPESMLRMRGMKGKSMLSSAGAASSAAAAADIRALPLVDQWQGMSTDSLFTPPPADNSLWNVSWPEMHAALAAGSTAAGAMLH